MDTKKYFITAYKSIAQLRGSCNKASALRYALSPILFLILSVVLLAWLTNPALAQRIKPEVVNKKMLPEFYDVNFKEVGGTFVLLEFKSYHPVVPKVAVSLKELALTEGSKDFHVPGGKIEVGWFPFPPVEKQQHQVLLKNLRPGSEHFLGIIGLRKQGEAGLPLLNRKFGTKQRVLEVNFEKIKMIDDSDDLSDGDFYFCFYLFDGVVNLNVDPIAWMWYPPQVAYHQFPEDDWIGSGDVKTVNVKIPIIWNKDSLLVAATGIDVDGSYMYGIYKEQKYLGTEVLGGWAGADVEFASNSAKVDLRGYLGDEISDDTGQKYTRKFTIDVGGGNITDVHFKVYGTVTAWYQSRLSEAGKKKVFKTKTRAVPK